MSDLEPVRLPAREIPPPTTISDAARKALSDGSLSPAPGWPPAHDLAAWREAIGGSAAMWAPLAAGALASCKAKVETRAIGGVTCHVGTPEKADGRVYLFIHGGAFVFGGGDYAKMWGGLLAERMGVTCVSVDYRMPPDHPFPAAPNDCLAVYRALLQDHDPKRIVIGGSSAGANLAAATMLMIRDQGLPAPAGLVLLTPEVDLTEAGDTLRTNVLLDVTLKGPLPECNALYAAGHDLTDPYLSPLYGEVSGFPPTLVQAGTRDVLLSNAVLMHRKLRKTGVEAELHVWEAMPHGGFGLFGFGDVPENAEIDDEVRLFIQRHT